MPILPLELFSPPTSPWSPRNPLVVGLLVWDRCVKSLWPQKMIHRNFLPLWILLAMFPDVTLLTVWAYLTLGRKSCAFPLSKPCMCRPALCFFYNASVTLRGGGHPISACSCSPAWTCTVSVSPSLRMLETSQHLQACLTCDGKQDQPI